ncbi:unnamed protein product [Acanthoscelides obtectus]|uniref:Uncharacterized protein n=1 Tax=Acanthoscelides obtectus TaxID=200917 RepID=A0A9P0JPL2_ACAOB|nr:unnamed protein product [Acanthoscelides obtectus]CAK1641426.1 hypothetical protein AOBTE_LOCUS12395 [Acanthoscelides obtectus]
MAVFGDILDISRVNSYVLLKASNENKKMTRREFTIMLGKSLIQAHLKQRLQVKELSLELPNTISKILGMQHNNTDRHDAAGPARLYERCSYCPRKKDRKVKSKCAQCQESICKDHSRQVVKCWDCRNRN